MLNLWLLSAALSAGPSLVSAIPADTDVALVFENDGITDGMQELWRTVEPLLTIRKDAGEALRRRVEYFGTRLEQVQKLLGVDLTKKGLRLHANFDFDAKGGLVYCVMVSGALGEAKPDAATSVESAEFAGQKLTRVAQGDFTWARPDKKTLLFGNERGVQRQLQHAKTSAKRSFRKAPREAILLQAARLRGTEPLRIAFALPTSVRQQIVGELGDIGRLLAMATSGYIAAGPKELTVYTTSSGKDTNRATAHGLRALAAFVNAGAGLVLGGGEVLLGNHGLEKTPRWVDEAPDDEALKGPLLDWLRDFSTQATVTTRQGTSTELRLKVSDYRALGAVLLAGVAVALLDEPVNFTTAEMALYALRRAEEDYKKKNGRYLSCAATPKRIPRGAVSWKGSRCFRALDFEPGKAMAVQLEAAIVGGKLVLTARGYDRRDGSLRVWVLREGSDRIRVFGGNDEKKTP